MAEFARSTYAVPSHAQRKSFHEREGGSRFDSGQEVWKAAHELGLIGRGGWRPGTKELSALEQRESGTVNGGQDSVQPPRTLTKKEDA